MIVRAAPPEHHPWIAERATLSLGPQFMAIEAVEGERVLAMVGFDGWTPSAVSLHVAVEHPAALRHVLKAGFGVAFDAPPRGFGRRLAVATVLGTNKKSLRLCEHLGFCEVGRLPDGWDKGVDLVFLAMRREDCRWIGEEQRWAA